MPNETLLRQYAEQIADAYLCNPNHDGRNRDEVERVAYENLKRIFGESSHEG